MSSNPASAEYQTEFTRRVYAVAPVAVATAINSSLAAGYGPDNFGIPCIGVGDPDDAEATHLLANAQVKPTGAGGAEELKALFGSIPGVSWCVVDAGGDFQESNVNGLAVGGVDAFLSACSLQHKVPVQAN